MSAQRVLPVEDSSQVGNARREAANMTALLGFSAEDAGKVALAITEAATNILKHASRGKILLRPLSNARTPGIEILALDRGPGMANVTASLRDGHSTAGSMGTGLGALQRLSHSFEIYSQLGRGTALRMEFWAERALRAEQAFEIGGVCLAKAGEPVSGDAWHYESNGRFLTLLVADGLGHGVDAAVASGAATRVLADHPLAEPPELIDTCHRALAPTRGAAVAVARLEAGAEKGSFAGIGNIVARVELARTRHLVSHNGTVGHTVRKIQEFAFPWPVGSLLILHSDGLGTHWDLAAYPGLATKHPSLIAGVLYRDFERGRDDVSVVVVRNTAGKR
jgi:anti-sigma regulatory factor (Ser/Thr protein kinase)